MKKRFFIIFAIIILCAGAFFACEEEKVCNHEYGEWEITRFPAEMEPGERATVCTVCNETITEQINYSVGLEYGYRNENGTAFVTGLGSCTDEIIYIPSTFEGCPVTEIKSRAYLGAGNTKAVIIPDTVKIIGFESMTGDSIETVYLPRSVGMMDAGAFDSRQNIKNIYIEENSNYKYEGNCIIDLSKKTLMRAFGDAVIPNDGSVEIIEFSAFAYNDTIKSVTIPESVKVIQPSAFAECTALEEVIFSEGLTDLGRLAFSDCTALKKVNLPSTLTNMGDAVFRDCTAIESVTLAEGLEFLGEYAFDNCTSLKNVTLPASLKTVMNGAFDGSGLTEIFIPKGITKLENRAFSACHSLTSLIFEEGFAAKIDSQAFYDCTALESVALPSSITVITERMFEGCTSLSKITVPNTVTSIESCAFARCPLKTIEFQGTTGEWRRIKKFKADGLDWNGSTGEYTVVCTNGTVEKS